MLLSVRRPFHLPVLRPFHLCAVRYRCRSCPFCFPSISSQFEYENAQIHTHRHTQTHIMHTNAAAAAAFIRQWLKSRHPRRVRRRRRRSSYLQLANNPHHLRNVVVPIPIHCGHRFISNSSNGWQLPHSVHIVPDGTHRPTDRQKDWSVRKYTHTHYV